MRTEWLTRHAELEAMAPRWDAAVAAAGSGNPFLLSEFLLTWSRAFVRDGDLRVCVVWAGETIRGGLPLFVKARRAAPHWPVLHAIGVDFANLTEPFFLGDAGEFWRHVQGALRDLPGWRLLRLPWVRPEALPPGGRPAVAGLQAGIAVDQDAAAYLATRTGLFQHNVRRSLRLAAAAGPVALRRIEAPEAVEALAARYLEFSRPLRERTGDRSGYTPAQWETFTRTLIARLARSGRLDAFALSIGPELGAIFFGYRYGLGLKGMLTSYNPALAACSPGTVLFYHLIDWCWLNGDPYLEMYAGGEDYKRRWCNRFRPVYDARWSRADPLSRLALGAYRLRRRLFHG